MSKQYYKYKIEDLFVIRKIVTIHYFEFDKDFTYPSESHDFWELVYADKESVICTADGEELVLEEGELLFHKPNEVHALRANRRTAPNVFIISFECKSDAMRFFEERRKMRLDKKLLRWIYAIIEESKNTFDLPFSDPAMKKLTLSKNPPAGGQQLIRNYLELLLIQLMRSESDREDTQIIFLPREEFGAHIANQAIDYMKQNLRNRLSVTEICTALNYNKSYLYKEFKNATGDSLLAYFTKLKIQQAKRWLRESAMTVSQISEQLAFDNPNYFTKTFKKMTGYTPLQYKKMHHLR